VNSERKTLAEKLAEYERKEAERQEAEEEAERQRLEEQGQFKELAEQAQAEAKTLKADFETLSERAKKMEAALQTYLEKEMEGVPEWVTPLLDKLDVTERLAWLAGNREQWAKRNGGPPPSPGAETKPGIDEEERRQKAYRFRF
jgi:DNA repair exonuclease SbcCD ATPase subunit